MNSLFNTYYTSIILQSEDDVKKMKQIFQKCAKGKDKALARWQKNIAKKKVSVYKPDKDKVLTISLEKFDKSPEKYIKYAEKFLPEEQDQQVDDKEVDDIVKEKEKKIQQIKKEAPDDAKKQLVILYKDTKKESPEAAKQIKKEIQEAISSVSTTTTKNPDGSTTTKTSYKLSGPILQKLRNVTETMAQQLRFKDKNQVKILYEVLLKYKDKHKRIKYMCDSYEKFKKTGPRGTVSTWLKFRAQSFRLNIMAIVKEKVGQELLKDLIQAYPKSKEEMKKIREKFASGSKGTSGATGMVV